MGYSYEYHYDMDDEIFEILNEFGPAIIGTLLIVLLVVMVFAVVFYVLEAMGLHTAAKRRGIRNPWLAWIPVANYWVLGCISDQYQYVVKGRVTNKRKLMIGLAVASFAVGLVGEIISGAMMLGSANSDSAMAGTFAVSTISSLINSGLSIAMTVFWHIALYDFYSAACPANNVLFLVLGIIFPVTQPFFIFFNRKKDGGMPPRREAPQSYIPQEPQWQPTQEPKWKPVEEPRDPWSNVDM